MAPRSQGGGGRRRPDTVRQSQNGALRGDGGGARPDRDPRAARAHRDRSLVDRPGHHGERRPAGGRAQHRACGRARGRHPRGGSRLLGAPQLRFGFPIDNRRLQRDRHRSRRHGRGGWGRVDVERAAPVPGRVRRRDVGHEPRERRDREGDGGRAAPARALQTCRRAARGADRSGLRPQHGETAEVLARELHLSRRAQDSTRSAPISARPPRGRRAASPTRSRPSSCRPPSGTW